MKKSKIVSIAFIFLLVVTVFYIFGCTSPGYEDEEPGCGSMMLVAIAKAVNPEGYDRAEEELFADYRSSMEERTGQSLEGWTPVEMQLLEAKLNRLEAEKKEAVQTAQAQEIETVEISEGTPQSDLESPVKEQQSEEMLCKDILGTWIGEIQYESVTGTYSADGQEIDVNELPLVTKKIGEIKKFELKIITGNDGCVANLDGFSGNVLYRDGQLEITFIEEPTKGNYTGQLVQDNKFEGKAETTNWFGDPIGVMFYSNWWAIKVE